MKYYLWSTKIYKFRIVKKAFLEDQKSGYSFLFTMAILAGSLAVLAVFSFFVIPFFGISISEFQEILSSPPNNKTINIFKFIQVLQFLIVFIIPALFIGYLNNRKPLNYLRFQNNIEIPIFLAVAFSMILALPLINLLAYFNQQMDLPAFMSRFEAWMEKKENDAEIITMAFLEVESIKGLIFNIFMIGILPALGEEMVFRGVIQKQIINIFGRKHMGVWLTAFFFSAIHLQFYGFLPRFVLGLYLGYLFLWTKNIWYPILAHFVNNTFIVSAYYFIQKSGSDYNMDNLGISHETFIMGGFSIFLSVILVIWIYRRSVSVPL